MTGTAIPVPYCKKNKSLTVWYGDNTAQNGRIAVYGMMGTRAADITRSFVFERLNKYVHSFIVSARWMLITLGPNWGPTHSNCMLVIMWKSLIQRKRPCIKH